MWLKGDPKTVAPSDIRQCLFVVCCFQEVTSIFVFRAYSLYLNNEPFAA